jgi:hypothetical protein
MTAGASVEVRVLLERFFMGFGGRVTEKTLPKPNNVYCAL